jgi:hypothetical protein
MTLFVKIFLISLFYALYVVNDFTLTPYSLFSIALSIVILPCY